jgi:tetratricopeptide (TPR) repeat protein
MASCAADELSQENILWGGGRGVFSYYLVNGLEGDADANNDQQVSKEELKNFLQMSLSKDEVLKSNEVKQTPIIDGRENFVLAKLSESSIANFKKRKSADSINNASLAPPAPPILGQSALSEQEVFKKQLDIVSVELLSEHLKKTEADNFANSAIEFLMSKTSNANFINALQNLQQKIAADDYERQQLNSVLATAFDDRGQELINAYLSGDEAELERRQYYNKDLNYQVYVTMFEQAAQLTDERNFFHKIVKVKYHYFKGLTLRMQILQADNPIKMLDAALAEQNKALQLEEHAAYIYNELGLLQQYKNKFPEALNHYQKAAALSPAWVLPRTNMALVYVLEQDYKKAWVELSKADSLCATCSVTTLMHGILNRKQQNYLFAEEDFRKSIASNDRSFLPYEELGHIYTALSKYQLADSFFYEASLRKQGLKFKGNDWAFRTSLVLAPSIELAYCPIDTAAVLKTKNVISILVWGIQLYKSKDYANAKRVFKIAIGIDHKAPLQYHFLGKMAFEEKQWEQAEIYFELANKYFKDEEATLLYKEEQLKKVVVDACAFNYLIRNNYQPIEDEYFLANVFSQRGFSQQAEKIYKTHIVKNAGNVYSIKLLEAIYIKQKRIAEAEALWKAYKMENEKTAIAELKHLYELQIAEEPFEFQWPYRLGLMLYEQSQKSNESFLLDTIIYFPLVKREIFIGEKFRNDSLKLTSFKVDERDFGAVVPIDIDTKKLELKEWLVLGTEEMLIFQPFISTPRIDAVKYFSLAMRLTKQEDFLSDINYKVGNVFRWAGSAKQAYPHYQEALALRPDNTSYGYATIATGKLIFENRQYFQLLRELNSKEKLNFEYRLLFAEALTNSGDAAAANNIFQVAKQQYPFWNENVAVQEAAIESSAGNYAKAISLYSALPSNSLLDGADKNYTVAMLYAKQGEKDQALNALSSAIKAGFQFGFVLDNDETWEKIRSSARWEKLRKNVNDKTYRSL